MATQADLVAKLTALAAQIQTNSNLVDSVLQLITGLKTQIQDLTNQLANAGVDQALVDQAQALVDAISATDTKLAAAVPTSTPAATP